MAGYTNKNNEFVELTDKHIEVAIKIKLELQKLSPSGKCNWSIHKKLMEKEGFYDSENSERYRVAIKKYQRDLNLLPSSQKYADLLSDKKLESLREMTGELFLSKRNAQLAHNELNKTKRAIADELVVISEIKELIKDLDFSNITHKKIEEYNSNKIAIATPSDWHIGQLYNGVGFETAEKRVIEYANQIIKRCKEMSVSNVIVANLGDIANNLYMHKNTQAFGSEFNVSEQIVKSTNLMFKFLNLLGNHLNVLYAGVIVGNHGRMSAKGETLTNDNFEVIVHEMVKSMISSAILQNKEYNVHDISDDTYFKDYVSVNIQDKNFVFVHGDKESKTGADRIKKYMSILNKPVDCLIQGHTHSFKVETENYGRLAITSGCLMGSDDYSENLGYRTNASQLLTIVDENTIIPININLHHII